MNNLLEITTTIKRYIMEQHITQLQQQQEKKESKSSNNNIYPLLAIVHLE